MSTAVQNANVHHGLVHVNNPFAHAGTIVCMHSARRRNCEEGKPRRGAGITRCQHFHSAHHIACAASLQQSLKQARELLCPKETTPPPSALAKRPFHGPWGSKGLVPRHIFSSQCSAVRQQVPGRCARASGILPGDRQVHERQVSYVAATTLMHTGMT